MSRKPSPARRGVLTSPPLSPTTTRRVSRPFIPSFPVSLPDLSSLDDRYFHPEKAIRPARTVSGSPARVVPLPPRSTPKRPSGASLAPFRGSLTSLSFAVPKRVLVCIRRKARREVILATGYGGANRSGRRSTFSHIRC